MPTTAIITSADSEAVIDSGTVTGTPVLTPAGAVPGKGDLLVATGLGGWGILPVTAVDNAQLVSNSARPLGMEWVAGGPAPPGPPAPTGYSSVILAEPGLVGYWRLGELSGTNANDAKGTNDGTLHAGVAFAAPGILLGVDTAAVFDGGADSQVAFGSAGLTMPFSLEAWVYCTGPGTAGTDTNFSTIFGEASLARAIYLLNDVGEQRIYTNIRDGVSGAAFSTPIGSAPLNEWLHIVYTYGTDQQERVYINGVERAYTGSPSASVAWDTPFFVGSYAATATCCAFKGRMDEIAVYNTALTPAQVLAHHAAAAVGISGNEARNVGMATYRSQFFAPTSYWKRLIPTPHPLFQHPTVPAANSLNWRRSLCTQMAFDPDTPQGDPVPAHLGWNPGAAWLNREYMHLYVVPEDQPLRPFTNITTNSTGADHFNAEVDRLGGLPIPLDVMGDNTNDRYFHIYQPSKNLFANLYLTAALDWATTTISMSGSPSSGTFTLRMWYGDNRWTPQWWTLPPLPYNATAAQVQVALETSVATAGPYSTGPIGYAESGNVTASGGPLPAPIEMQFWVSTPNEAVRFEVIADTLNQGNVVINEHPAGPIDRCRNSGLLAPNPANPGGVATAHGTYIDRVSGSTYYENRFWGGAATGIEFMGGYASSDEVAIAQANETGLNHALVLNVGIAQLSPVPYVYPAIRADGAHWDATIIAEGAHVALPQDVDLSYCEANAPEWTWALRTLRDRGAFVPDKSGYTCGLMFRRMNFQGINDVTIGAPNPWYDILPKYQNPDQNLADQAAHDYMALIPWHRAEIIDPNASLP